MRKSSSAGFITLTLLLLAAALTAVSLQLGSLLRSIAAAELLMEPIETHLEPDDECAEAPRPDGGDSTPNTQGRAAEGRERLFSAACSLSTPGFHSSQGVPLPPGRPAPPSSVPHSPP